MDIERRRPWRKPGLLFMACAIAFPCARTQAQEEDEAGAPSPIQISHDDAGNAVLTVDAETQARVALQTGELLAQTLQSEVIAFGLLEEDPAQSFTLRSQVSGYLRPERGAGWPTVGQRIEDGAVLAGVEPRLTPTESLDLLTRWLDARAEVDEQAAEVEAARLSFENKKHLNEDGKLVSDRSMEEAEAKLKSSEARLAGAKERAEALERVMPRQDASPQTAMTVPHGGEVVEVMSRPDEVVESGQGLLRVNRFESLVARVAAPLGTAVLNPLPRARIVIVGAADSVLPGEPLGRAPSTDATMRGDTLLYRVESPQEMPLRPGTPVIAHIPTTGETTSGALVPRSALLRYGGLTWVYVASSETQFVRRSVELLSPLENGWLVTSGVAPGERVVTSGAQYLLSEELKAQIESEEEAEE